MNLKQILSENYPSVIKQYCMPIRDIKVLLDKQYNVLQMYGTSTVAKFTFLKLQTYEYEPQLPLSSYMWQGVMPST